MFKAGYDHDVEQCLKYGKVMALEMLDRCRQLVRKDWQAGVSDRFRSLWPLSMGICEDGH